MSGIVFSLLLKRGSPNRTSFREIIAVGCGVPARKAVAVAGEGIEKERFCLPVVDYLLAHRARSAVGVEVDDVGIYHYSSKIPRLHRNALCGHGEVEMVGVIPIDVGIRSIKLPIIVLLWLGQRDVHTLASLCRSDCLAAYAETHIARTAHSRTGYGIGRGRFRFGKSDEIGYINVCRGTIYVSAVAVRS